MMNIQTACCALNGIAANGMAATACKLNALYVEVWRGSKRSDAPE